ncbi:MAG TPA: redoxin domain-containing protein [Chloroflexota bacterium]
MTGWWLVSYAALWAVVGIVVLLQIGMLREIGLLQTGNQRQDRKTRQVPFPEQGGPAVGSELPNLVLETGNGHGSIRLKDPADGRATLLIFMTPLCEGCQHAVDLLNALAGERSGDLRLIVIIRGPEQTCRSFLSVFPLRAPTVFDTDDDLIREFDVRLSPFGLLYHGRGTLVRKGWTENRSELAALLGDTSVPRDALLRVFPSPAQSIELGSFDDRASPVA